MVKGQRKRMEEIVESVDSYGRILTIGCGGCMSVCLAGGQKEVAELNTELEVIFKSAKRPKQIAGYTVERQCTERFLTNLDEQVAECDCILSMACGAGVQLIAEKYPEKPVFPAVNTLFIGIDRAVGWYEEKCRACGQCVLAYTGGVCPVTRCAKSLFNGPCGGTQNGSCEVNKDIPCAWHDIYYRLKKQGRLEHILKISPPVQWQNQAQRVLVLR